jgi:predicted Zn-dependent protease
VDTIYPISYEIISWVLRVLMFEKPTELYQNAHFNDITCVMNFCEDLKKHEIKTKTGELCKDCIDRINNKGISQEKLMEIYSSLDKIRNFILNRENHIIYPTIKVVRTEGEKIQLILPEYGGLIIPLEQRLISVYWFFLRNDQDIFTKSLKNYREEILSLHSTVNRRYSPAKVAETIDKILGLSSDSVYKSKEEFSSVKSKINGKIKEIIPFKISKDYLISGVRMEPNRVLLNRKYFIDLK